MAVIFKDVDNTGFTREGKFVAIFLCVVVLWLFIAITNSGDFYTRYATVVNQNCNTVVVEDEVGNLWQFDSGDFEENFLSGSRVKLQMRTMHTEGIEDDLITAVNEQIITEQYRGFIK